jgi:hypothetical protein
VWLVAFQIQYEKYEATGVPGEFLVNPDFGFRISCSSCAWGLHRQDEALWKEHACLAAAWVS